MAIPRQSDTAASLLIVVLGNLFGNLLGRIRFDDV